MSMCMHFKTITNNVQTHTLKHSNKTGKPMHSLIKSVYNTETLNIVYNTKNKGRKERGTKQQRS